MTWTIDRRATDLARQLFPQCADLVAARDGAQYLIQPTPFGPVELIGVTEGYLVAARNPPRPPEPGHLAGSWDRRILLHLEENQLKPWKVIPTHEFAAALRSLAASAAGEGDERGETGLEPAPPFSHYVALPAPRPELVGEDRLRVGEQLAVLTDVDCQEAPLVQLTGPDGVGKRTVVARLATAGYRLLGELVLGRLFVRRVFSTGPELAVETLLAAGQAMQARDVLLVSGAELLATVPGRTAELILHELRRLPHVVLIGRSGLPPSAVPVVALSVPGLQVDEAQALLAAAHPEIEFGGPAQQLLIQAARTPQGVIPGRLFYLLQLARALTRQLAGLAPCLRSECVAEPSPRVPPSRPLVLSPDDVSAAIGLVQQAWTQP